MKTSRTSRDPDMLRRAAEGIAVQRRGYASESATESQRVLHELEVYEIELEMQNEELRSSRAEADAALKRYSELFDFAPVGYFVLATDTTVQEVNLMGSRLLGLDSAMIVGRRFQAFLSQPSLTDFNQVWSSVFGARPDSFSRMTRTLQLDVSGREPIDVELTACALATNPSVGLVSVQNISEAQRASEALHAQLIGRDDLFAELSQELRLPLAPLRSSLFVLQHASPGCDAARRALEVIGRQVDLLSRLVDDMLDVSRVAQMGVQLRRQQLDMGELVRSAWEAHRQLFERRGIRVDCRIEQGPHWVDGDATRLLQVIGSVLSHALRATPPRGELDLGMRRDGADVAVWVHSSGPGAGLDARNAFLRSAGTDTRSTHTRAEANLRLGMSAYIMHAHGGSVEHSSPSSDHGEMLTLRLPLDEGAHAETSVLAADTPVRVLLIEDDPDTAESMRDVLELQGCDVRIGLDGMTGLDLARAFEPQAMVCAIELPDMDGCEVARELREDKRFAGTLMVAMTALPRREEAARCLRAGFDRHISKPADGQHLAKVMGLGRGRGGEW